MSWPSRVAPPPPAEPSTPPPPPIIWNTTPSASAPSVVTAPEWVRVETSSVCRNGNPPSTRSDSETASPSPALGRCSVSNPEATPPPLCTVWTTTPRDPAPVVVICAPPRTVAAIRPAPEQSERSAQPVAVPSVTLPEETAVVVVRSISAGVRDATPPPAPIDWAMAP